VRVTPVPFLVGFSLPGPVWADGTLWLFMGFLLVNLLVFLEVADRLTLKNDLEIARDIQRAMLPQGTFAADGVEAAGWTRPANTVGGDSYDILPLADGRLLVVLGDVDGKGSPAALLMALLLAMLRTLAKDNLPPGGPRRTAQSTRPRTDARVAIHHDISSGVRPEDGRAGVRQCGPDAPVSLDQRAYGSAAHRWHCVGDVRRRHL